MKETEEVKVTSLDVLRPSNMDMMYSILYQVTGFSLKLSRKRRRGGLSVTISAR